MPTELEELVEFLHHGNTQIRQLATQNLVPYSSLSQQFPLFKRQQLEPIKDLKLLVKDYPPIQKDALQILINLSAHNDRDITRSLCDDEKFINELLRQIIDRAGENSNVDLCCGVLANLTKDDDLAKRLITLERKTPPPIRIRPSANKEANGTTTTNPTPNTPQTITISISPLTINQLTDLFILPSHAFNSSATFDYLSYIFADLSKHSSARSWLLTPQPYDSVVPLSKLIVFMEHGSLIRRKGVAGVLKNICFEVESHEKLLRDEGDEGGIGLLPYILLPLAGPEELDFGTDGEADVLPELQLLGPDKKREGDGDIVVMLVETLLLLTTTRMGREKLRRVGTYPVIKELHLHWRAMGGSGAEGKEGEVREVCERLVDVLMRDEEKEDDEDTRVEEVF